MMYQCIFNLNSTSSKIFLSSRPDLRDATEALKKYLLNTSDFCVTSREYSRPHGPVNCNGLMKKTG